MSNENYNYKKLTPFKWFVLQNFPFIDEDFDAITNYQLFCKLGEEINKIIDSENLLGTEVENLSHYFDNLDVTEEINNKLDEMAQDGTLTTLIESYINPYITAQNERINQSITEQNANIATQRQQLNESISVQNSSIDTQNIRIANLETIINGLSNFAPIPVTSTSDMTDTTKLYLLTTDGKWYYYNGSNFVAGGTYQSAENSDQVTTNKKDLEDITYIKTYNTYDDGELPSDYELVNSTGTLWQRTNINFGQLPAYYQFKANKYYFALAKIKRNAGDTTPSGIILINPYQQSAQGSTIPFNAYSRANINYANFVAGTEEIVYFGFKPTADTNGFMKIVGQNIPSSSHNVNLTFTSNVLLELNSESELLDIIKYYKLVSQRGFIVANDKIGNLNYETLKSQVDSIEVPTYDTDIIFWGDSLTAGAGGSGTSYPSVVGNLLNKEIMNMGIGGETSFTILARQGSITPIIPANADCSSFVLKDLNGNNIEPLIQGNSGVNPIKIGNDDTEYTLSRNQDGTYKITYNNNVIQSSNVPRFIKFAGSELSGTITVIFAGQNGARGTTLLNQLKNAVRKCLNNKYVIVGLTTGTTASRQSLNDLMYAEFGNKFFDAGEYVSKYGMALMNMTPTAEDNVAIEQGSIPPSLLVDQVHMNASGYTAMGTFLANFIKSLNY